MGGKIGVASVGKLTAAKVRGAKPGFGSSGKPVKRAYQDGDGLFLLVKPTGLYGSTMVKK